MIKDHKTKIGGLTVYYRTAGDPKKQTLVFLHGWGARLGRLRLVGSDSVIDELSKHFYVMAPEHPGLIRSEGPKKPWNYEDYAEHLNKLISHLELENFILLGQSFGGGIATAYAAVFPKRIKNLVLVDSVFGGRLENFYFKGRKWWSLKYSKILKSSFVPTVIKNFVISSFLGVPVGFVDKKTLENRLLMGKIMGNLKLETNYKDLKTPTLLVWGMNDTFITPINRAREIQTEIKSSKLVTTTGGHSILYRKPKEVVSLIVKNLEKL